MYSMYSGHRMKSVNWRISNHHTFVFTIFGSCHISITLADNVDSSAPTSPLVGEFVAPKCSYLQEYRIPVVVQIEFCSMIIAQVNNILELLKKGRKMKLYRGKKSDILRIIKKCSHSPVALEASSILPLSVTSSIRVTAHRYQPFGICLRVLVTVGCKSSPMLAHASNLLSKWGSHRHRILSLLHCHPHVLSQK